MFKRKLPQHEVIHDYRLQKQQRQRFWPIIGLGLLLFLCLVILTLGAVEPAVAEGLDTGIRALLEQQQQQIKTMELALAAEQEKKQHLLASIGLVLAYLLLFGVVYFSIQLEDETQLVLLQKKSRQGAAP